MDVSFGTIWEAIARDLPDAVAISEPARDYTFAEFEDRAARLATVLAATVLAAAGIERATVTITDAIASSEGGPFAYAVTSSVADLPSRFYPVAATRVLTATGAPVVPGSGEVGTLAFGGSIPSGYYKDEAKTSATFRVVGGVRYTMPGDRRGGWGDRFLGRGAGVINTGGEKVPGRPSWGSRRPGPRHRDRGATC
jgi:acyl-CoA synthetase (AMP-forming)/AMP-acid ligase II